MAYEMRISDWSSDVGSSDLLAGGEALERIGELDFGLGAAVGLGGLVLRGGAPAEQHQCDQGSADHKNLHVGPSRQRFHCYDGVSRENHPSPRAGPSIPMPMPRGGRGWSPSPPRSSSAR